MTIEIKWSDDDPETGERRYLRAEKFAGEWRFGYRRQRRDVRWLTLEPTRSMWEYVLDSLRRRCQRGDGVEDGDVKQVERLLRDWREPPDS